MRRIMDKWFGATAEQAASGLLTQCGARAVFDAWQGIDGEGLVEATVQKVGQKCERGALLQRECEQIAIYL